MIIKIENGLMTAHPETQADVELLLGVGRKVGRHVKTEVSYPIQRERKSGKHARVCPHGCGTYKGKGGLGIHMATKHGVRHYFRGHANGIMDRATAPSVSA